MDTHAFVPTQTPFPEQVMRKGFAVTTIALVPEGSQPSRGQRLLIPETVLRQGLTGSREPGLGSTVRDSAGSSP